jgi:hypothetical protein
MTAILIFNIALDAAISSVIVALCLTGIVRDAYGAGRTVAVPWLGRARWLRLERTAVGAA